MADDEIEQAAGGAAAPPDGAVVAVHSLLHCNLNTSDVHGGAAFYGDVLGLSVGMKTDPTPVDGGALGVSGEVLTQTWFLYDHRGPRAAPAIELLEWRSPALVGEQPPDAHHVGLSALGYRVASLTDVTERLMARDVEITGPMRWPVGAERRAAIRATDPDGVALELIEDAGPRSAAGPVFSHARLNCTDLAASVRWYTDLGFRVAATADRVVVPGGFAGLPDEAVLSVASLVLPGEQAVSFELTQWHLPLPDGRASSPAYHRGLYRVALAVDDVRAAYTALSRLHPTIPEPLWVPLPGTRLGGLDVLFLRDPDGVVVELVQRPRSAMRGLSHGA